MWAVEVSEESKGFKGVLALRVLWAVEVSEESKGFKGVLALRVLWAVEASKESKEGKGVLEIQVAEVILDRKEFVVSRAMRALKDWMETKCLFSILMPPKIQAPPS